MKRRKRKEGLEAASPHETPSNLEKSVSRSGISSDVENLVSSSNIASDTRKSASSQGFPHHWKIPERLTDFSRLLGVS